MTLGKSLEDYLETILILKIKKGMVRSIDVADYMGFSKPRVSHAVKQLKTQGFLLMDNNGQLLLTVGRIWLRKFMSDIAFLQNILQKWV